MNIRFLTENEYGWSNFVEHSKMGSIFQSYEWRIQATNQGWFHDVLVVEEKGELMGGAILSWKKVPFLSNKIFKISYGPVWNNDQYVLKILCEETIKIVKERKALCLEFQIYLPEYINEKIVEDYLYVNDILLSNGFNKLPERKETYWINLEEDEDDIFDNLGKNHKRDIKKGIREGVQIKVTNSTEMANTFYEYYSTMCHNKKLVPVPENYFKKGLKDLLKIDKCKLFYAEYEGKIYNMAVISLFGNPMYVFGASISSEKKPPMGQLLHWEIIKWLKKNNYKIYDLGGTPGDVPQKEHSNYWVWRFKKGFNGDYVRFLSNYVVVFSRTQYWLYQKVLPIYRKYFHPGITNTKTS